MVLGLTTSTANSGLGDTASRLAPTQVGTDLDWAKISVDGTDYGSHTCGVRTDGSLWCWGYNERRAARAG